LLQKVKVRGTTNLRAWFGTSQKQGEGPSRRGRYLWEEITVGIEREEQVCAGGGGRFKGKWKTRDERGLHPADGRNSRRKSKESAGNDRRQGGREPVAIR